MLVLSQHMPCYITIQELIDLKRKQAEASSEELQRKFEELKKLLQERHAQVSATARLHR